MASRDSSSGAGAAPAVAVKPKQRQHSSKTKRTKDMNQHSSPLRPGSAGFPLRFMITQKMRLANRIQGLRGLEERNEEAEKERKICKLIKEYQHMAGK